MTVLVALWAEGREGKELNQPWMKTGIASENEKTVAGFSPQSITVFTWWTAVNVCMCAHKRACVCVCVHSHMHERGGVGGGGADVKTQICVYYWHCVFLMWLF